MSDFPPTPGSSGRILLFYLKMGTELGTHMSYKNCLHTSWEFKSHLFCLTKKKQPTSVMPHVYFFFSQ
jgi:hypothetical protein